MIEGSIGPALSDGPQTFAVLESTGKGAGNYSHNLWKQSVALWENGEKSDWKPVFLPWFMDATHILPPEKGWTIEQPEIDMSTQVCANWVRCNNPECSVWRDSSYRGESRIGTICKTCGTGEMESYILSPEQLCWMWSKRINAERDEKSLNTLRIEQCVTAEDCWSASGISAFSPRVQQFFSSTKLDPIIAGDIDSGGNIHGLMNPSEVEQGAPAKCYLDRCTANHRFDDIPLKIWEKPRPGCRVLLGG